MKRIQTVAVIGAGAMGSQIAVLAALAGCQTTVMDIDRERAEGALAAALAKASRQADRGQLDPAAVKDASSRVRVVTDLPAAVEGADIVIEAIVENLDAKRSLFAELGELTGPETVLATNSSSIVSSKLAAVPHPERVCNMHFFNPALVMNLVEVVGGGHTSEETLTRVAALARGMGKEAVILRTEIFGFIANRIIGAVFDEAISLYESGIASPEDIDTAVTLGLGHPLGPFALLDLTGIDVNLGIKVLEAQETGDPGRGPSQTLLTMHEQGRLGRKSGRGFYDYGAAR